MQQHTYEFLYFLTIHNIYIYIYIYIYIHTHTYSNDPNEAINLDGDVVDTPTGSYITIYIYQQYASTHTCVYILFNNTHYIYIYIYIYTHTYTYSNDPNKAINLDGDIVDMPTGNYINGEFTGPAQFKRTAEGNLVLVGGGWTLR